MRFSRIYRLPIYVLFVILTLSVGRSQTLEIRDSKTNQPLEGVAIFDAEKSKSVITDSSGKAALDIFNGQERLTLQLLGYHNGEFLLNRQETDAFFMTLDEKQEALDEVILSVARTESTRRKIAEKVAVIRANDIAFSAPATGADLLELSPGVRIQKSQGGGGSPVLRGFEANRVLLVIDGVRLNNAIYRSGHLQNAITVDPHNIERVEVIFGSSSVGYGSDALGGVIHYYTKSPEINGLKKIKHAFTSEYNSANTSSINNFSTALSFKNWGSRTSFSYSNFGDIRIGKNRIHGYADWGLTPLFSENNRNTFAPEPTVNDNPNIQKNTAYKQYDLFQKFIVNLPRQKQLTLNMQLSNSSDIPRYDKLVETREGSLRYAEWYYGPQFRLLVSPRLKFYADKKLLQKGSITLAYQKVKESRISRAFNSLERSHQEETVDVVSLNGDFDSKISDKHALSYGFESTYNKVYSLAYTRELQLNQNQITGYGYPLSIPSRYPSAGSAYTSFAGYANWSAELNPNFTFNAGLRLTHTLLEAKWKESSNVNALLSSASLNATALTQTLAITYRTSKNTQWSTMISSGFRNPNIDDIGKIRESKGILVVPNVYLKPEYAYNFEMGWTKYGQASKNYLSLRGFASLISSHILRSDYIVYADESTPSLSTIRYEGNEVFTVSNKNLGDRFLYGGSIDGRMQLGQHFDGLGSLTYTKSDKNANYGPLPSIAPIFGDLKLRYQKKRFYATAVLRFSGKKNPDDYSWGGEDGLEETPQIPFNFAQQVIPNAAMTNMFHVRDQNADFYYAGSPAWTDLSFQTQYQLQNHLKLRFGINNVFDQHYRPFASGISAPGRNIRLGLHVDF